MRRRYNLAYFLLAVVIALVLTPLMVDAAPRAQIAFSSDRDGNYDIYVMDADGKNQQRLTRHGDDDWEPSWSPDGKQIAFTSSEDRDSHEDVAGQRPHIYVMDADGKNRRKLTKNPFAEWHPSWSPDGKHLAFTGMANTGAGTYVYAVDAEGKNLRRLTPLEMGGWEPSWSPDGKHLAFTGVANIGADVYAVDAEGKNLRRLTPLEMGGRDPSWSPDGERIAFTSNSEPDLPGGNLDIYLIDVDGGNQRRVTRNPSPDTNPSWSPDGKRIVFVSTRDGNPDIYVMNADGARQVRRLTKGGSEDMDPAWFDPAFAVEVAPFAVGPVGKKFTMWGWLKQVGR